MSPDITMCLGRTCPVKKHCYRYAARPDQWQSYFAEMPFEKVLGKYKKCKYFWDTRKEALEWTCKIHAAYPDDINIIYAIRRLIDKGPEKEKE